MARYSRILIALTILLSGLALIPQAGIFAGVVRWQRFAGGYEDVVTVTRARYRDGELEARAISSSGGLPTLSVYRTSDNSFIGNLIFDPSEGDHRADFPLGSNPQVITVRSSLGGESTVLVTDGSGVPVTVTPSITCNARGTHQHSNFHQCTPDPNGNCDTGRSYVDPHRQRHAGWSYIDTDCQRYTRRSHIDTDCQCNPWWSHPNSDSDHGGGRANGNTDGDNPIGK